MGMGTYHFHLGSCIDFMRTRAAGSVNFFVVDSPYENTDLTFDKQPVPWPEFWMEAERILAPNGVIICFAAELFTLDLIVSNRKWYRYRRVWVKSKGSRYMDNAWRPLAAHEDLVIFAPQIKSATYNPQKTEHTGPRKKMTRTQVKQAHYKSQRFAGAYEDDGTHFPTTVMFYPSVGTTANRFNQTAKPLLLVQELVLTYTNPGDTVFEPFAGDAPAGRVCLPLGRYYLGCETNSDQYEWSATQLRNLASTPTLLSQLAMSPAP